VVRPMIEISLFN